MSTLVVAVEQTQALLDVDQPTIVEVDRQTSVVTIESPAPEIVEVVARGPQGIQGPPGPAGIDAAMILSYPVTLVDGQPDDLLSFTGSGWRNKPQGQVTDGGNF